MSTSTHKLSQSAVHYGTIVSGSGSSTAAEEPVVEEAGSSKAHGASVADGVYHIICVIAGSGILQLPYALKQGGWFSTLLILFAAYSNEYSGQLLVKCLYYGGSRLKGYSHIGYVAYGKRGRNIVETFFHAMLLGVPVVYIILSGLNLSILVGYFSTRGWIVIVSAVMLIPFLFFSSLKEVAIFSAFGVFATILAISTVVWYSAQQIISNGHNAASDGTGVEPVTHKWIDFAMIPSALGSISFSFAGNFVYPEVERSLAKPEQFPLVLSLSMIFITIMYVVTAVLGYGAYGDKTVSPILNNLPSGFVSKFAIGVITAHVLLAIPSLDHHLLWKLNNKLEMERRLGILENPFTHKPLQPLNETLEDSTEPLLGHEQTHITAPATTPAAPSPSFAKKHPILTRSILRVAILTFLCIVALVVPYFDDCMTLLGACANTALIFVLPPVFDFKLFGWSNRSVKEKVYGVTLIAVGLFAGVVGGAAALKDLADDIRGDIGNNFSWFDL
ncbi:transmembrane amino acid transporter protein-domain-containing protein [Cladochytrium replicatum]|nr:transmembrane amino acid transporter protein-domain-containing protein [Cladochytrium replicatum]